ncbi:MAG: hypothetical protein GX456_17000 [Verrucomicrobia bacterium]|nr:hypothetical protein [Verrucomicrobiota bacterium]
MSSEQRTPSASMQKTWLLLVRWSKSSPALVGLGLGLAGLATLGLSVVGALLLRNEFATHGLAIADLPTILQHAAHPSGINVLFVFTVSFQVFSSVFLGLDLVGCAVLAWWIRRRHKKVARELLDKQFVLALYHALEERSQTATACELTVTGGKSTEAWVI